MKVKFLTGAISASEVYNPGQVYDIDKAWALALIQSGSAEAVDEPRKRSTPRDKVATTNRGKKAVRPEPEYL